MADNRMWLLHKPTGKAVLIGKKDADGWCVKAPMSLGDNIGRLFAGCEGDDWTLAMEDASGATSAFEDWSYSENPGILKVLDNGD